MTKPIRFRLEHLEEQVINRGKTINIVGFHAAKKHPIVPSLDRFQGKNKNRSSLTRTISTSRRSFFANLITFERRSGLKISSPKNRNFENGVIDKISKS